ncbi:6-carboxytetrahydropterin synthase [Saccharophagus degradans]|uniref:6-pyruvoyl trahydropterin synthase family protein n=1 Tax=Saccharophagus degradans TaxID=86304 RepID=UPI0024781E6C|nr:6-carboxytetrahydropterin synthase [Saccharophagus degradans]WGO97348.1 6-carboxytetrahydropterin synthase [Saccharophagus degradans]
MQLFVDNLTNLDFSYLHPTRGVVGETWLASVVLDGALDEQGMVCDFGIVKKMLREWLDNEIDHRLLVPTQASALTISSPADRASLSWPISSKGTLSTDCPEQAIARVTAESITPESVAQWAITQLQPLFPQSVNKLSLTFTPETITTPFYHYSHGLKKHGGNCQRIAHGHRSKIEIWRNGELSLADMSAWADLWADIYIGTEEDVVSTQGEHTAFVYTAQQGEFSLKLPSACVYMIDTDTTVEFIAQHIANTLKQQHPADSFTVKAYEGLAKGAIASS